MPQRKPWGILHLMQTTRVRRLKSNGVENPMGPFRVPCGSIRRFGDAGNLLMRRNHVRYRLSAFGRKCGAQGDQSVRSVAYGCVISADSARAKEGVTDKRRSLSPRYEYETWRYYESKTGGW